jgi:hypothetical protein
MEPLLHPTTTAPQLPMDDPETWAKVLRLRLDAFEQRQDRHDERLDVLESSLVANTAATQRVEANTSEVVSLLQSFKGGFKVLDLLGKVAIPLGAIAGAVGAFWLAIKGGKS